MALTVGVAVSPGDREVLEGWLRSSSLRAGLAQRAWIVLLAAEGVGTGEIVHQSQPGWAARCSHRDPPGPA